MNRYFFLPVVFVFFAVGAADRHAYISVILAIFGAAFCVADLERFGVAILNNRGRLVAIFFVLMILSVSITF
ncbi:MAG: hypothetical protein EOO32_01165 [Comamonadaceae bacterium]|nr:MAG: hypothetical protein EOO32_01165 [Comamonadaceae bacterium]